MATNDLSDVTGFILREFPYKETSKILEVFTREYGKISIIAKGINGKNKSSATSRRFAKVNVNLYKSGKDFYGIKEISLIDGYSKSNKNFDVILYKSAIADLLLRTIDQTQIDIVYKLLDNTFLAFENAKENQINIFLAFLLKYISFSGFKPNLLTCGICERTISNEDLYFSKSQSSLICSDHRYQIYDKIFLTREEFVYLKKLLYTNSEELSSVKLVKSIDKLTNLIIDYTLEKLEITRFSSMDWVYKKAFGRN